MCTGVTGVSKGKRNGDGEIHEYSDVDRFLKGEDRDELYELWCNYILED